MKWLCIVFLFSASCFAASSEKLAKDVACNHEANGGLKIINQARQGIPEEKWFDLFPIPEGFDAEVTEVIQKAVKDAYKFDGDSVDFMRKIYAECLQR